MIEHFLLKGNSPSEPSSHRSSGGSGLLSHLLTPTSSGTKLNCAPRASSEEFPFTPLRTVEEHPQPSGLVPRYNIRPYRGPRQRGPSEVDGGQPNVSETVWGGLFIGN